MEAERAFSKSCYFVTLTYEDSNLYYRYPDCPPSLSKEHYKTFMKNLRKLLPFPLRFFGVGEYGSESKRPHYHFLFFLPDYMSKSQFGDLIRKVWTKGFVTVRDGSSKRMYYIAKYCVKGSECPFGTESPFQSSSQSPPIGGKFFEQNYGIYRDNSVNYFLAPDGRRSSIPRSFENRYKAYIDSLPRSSLDSPSLIRKRVLTKRASNRLRDYLNAYNSHSPAEIIDMISVIERRYENKHKHKLNQV